MNRPFLPLAGFLLVAAALPGCGGSSESSYGRVWGKGLNGTSAFAGLLRSHGHSVRVAVRLNDELAKDADTLVRFAPYAGPADVRESAWYAKWLADDPGRRLLYVVRGYDARPDFWAEAQKGLTKPEDEPRRAKARKLIEEAKDRAERDYTIADRSVPESPFWFRTAPSPPGPHAALQGEWSEGVDPAAAIPLRETLVQPRQGAWYAPLISDDAILVLEGSPNRSSGAALVVANGAFLLNGGLLNRARRPLTQRVVDWVEEGGHRVVFVEGKTPRANLDDKPGDSSDDDDSESGSGLALGSGGPLDLIVYQFLGFGLLGCLYLGTRLGRPKGDAPPGVGRPSAHAEALGDLLARTPRPEDAQAILDAYRRWRTPDRPAKT